MRPDFSGTFTLNRTLSDFAFLKPPKMRVDSIVHADPALTVTTLWRRGAISIPCLTRI